MLKTTRSYLHLSRRNTETWRSDRQTDGQTEMVWLLQRSALRAMRTRCKNQTEWNNCCWCIKLIKSSCTAQTSDTICDSPCNFKTTFIHWDLLTLIFRHLTSKIYFCWMRLTHSLSLKLVWLPINSLHWIHFIPPPPIRRRRHSTVVVFMCLSVSLYFSRSHFLNKLMKLITITH